MPRLAACSLPCLLVLLLVTGCESGVDPFIDAGRHFTLYGYLDTDRDTQFVRVVPLRRRVDPPPPGPTGATVTTTDLETGAVMTWRDSVVTFSDGTSGNVFYGVFRPRFGHRYRLEARDEVGNSTTATTRVPAFPDAIVSPANASTGTIRTVTQEVFWPGVDYEPLRVQVWYRVAPARPGEPFRDVPVTYADAEDGMPRQGGWHVVANLGRDVEKVMAFLEQADQPALYNVGMKLSVSDENWRPPGDVFDPEILVQPDVFTNVENGFGFFGAVAQQNAEWTLTPQVTEQLGYPYPNR